MALFERYYGGRTLEGVANSVYALGALGHRACVSLLPRYHFRPRGVENEKYKILAILPFLKARGLNADLTVKLSQLGQRWAPQECHKALGEIAGQAAAVGSFVWVDMEQSALVGRTIEEFLATRAEHPNVGICLQTCLQRTERDLEHLLKGRHPVRLVKGYYRERPPDCWETWEQTTDCFRRLLTPLIQVSDKPAIGTHDESLVLEARKVLKDNPRPEFEFQFFLGAKPALEHAAAKAGHRTRVYIPYGPLLPYFLHTLPYMDFSRNLQRLFGFEKIH